MAFELKAREPIPRGVRRVVCDRIDRALETFAHSQGETSDDSVHDVRKRIKQIRGALRMVRDGLGEKTFKKENRAFRDAARPLSAARDAKVLVDALDGLIEHANGTIEGAKLAWLRRTLVEKRQATRKQALGRGRGIDGVVRALEQARMRVSEWPLADCDVKAVKRGVRNAYAKARRAMKRARKDDSDAALHEWRKRTKDVRYQFKLLIGICKRTAAPLEKQAHDLSDLLGEDHDLCVLADVVQREKRRDRREVEFIEKLIARRRKELQRKAWEIGEKLFDERPRDFLKQLRPCIESMGKPSPALR
jgi:CHAD domain-containing protein